MEFTGEDILEFEKRFPDDKSCLANISELKWSNGFTCTICGQCKYEVSKNNSARDCNRCHHIESHTAGTIFHCLRFNQRKAFGIMFKMTTTTKGLSASQVARRYSIHRTTAWTFMQRIRTAIQSGKKHPIVEEVRVDEFVYGGKESLKQCRSKDVRKKKIVGTVELNDKGELKRAYFKKLDDNSSKSLRCVFDIHISKEAQVKTDKWKGYTTLRKDLTIDQKYFEKGGDMKQMPTIIYQLKSWLRSAYSRVHHGHIEKHLDEFSFRINSSIFRKTIFHSLTLRMLKAEPLTFQQIKLSS